MAFKILPLEDMNALTAHILETVNTHMILRNNLTVRTQRCRFHLRPFLGHWYPPKGGTLGSLGRLYTRCGAGSCWRLWWRCEGALEGLRCRPFPAVSFGNLVPVSVN